MVSITPLSKETLTYPEWEQQVPTEKNKHHFMFDLFCRHGGTPSHFARDIEGTKKGQIFNGVELLYDAYAYDSMIHIASAHLWIYRRELKQKYDKDYRIKQYDKIDNENAIDNYEQKERIKKKILNVIEQKLTHNQINGTQTKDYVTAYNGIQDSQDKDKGEDTQKMKIDLDSKNEVNVKEEKRHVFTESQKEIINNFTGEPDEETKKFLDEL